MHTTWRAPVAWLLCFSARFVVLDTLLSSSLAPTIASLLDLCLFIPSRSFPRSYIYIFVPSLFLLALDRFESFSLLPLEVLRSSVALTLSLFSLPLLLPLSLSLSLSRYSKYSSLAISFPLDRLNAAHSEERNELKSTHSSPASRSFSPSFPRRRPSTSSYPESFSREHSFLSLCLSASSSAAATRSQPVPSKRGGSGSKRIPLLPSPSRSRHDPTESVMLVSGLTETDTSLFNRSILLLFFLDLFFPFFFRVESKSLEVREIRRVCEVFFFF